MGQLIKLLDYVSRYEQNIYHYPSRFVRLKKQQWENFHSEWESLTTSNHSKENDVDWDDFYDLRGSDNEQSFRKRIKGFLPFWKRKKEDAQDDAIMGLPPVNSMLFTNTDPPTSVEELKHLFLDKLFRFQMKWASSTLTEQSMVHKQFYKDETLQFFLKRLPDNYLILYKPVFLIKNAPVEVDIIIISPMEVFCITFIDEEDEAVFIATDEHFWLKRHLNKEEKVLNPLISLNRMFAIVEELLRLHEIEFPIKKIIFNRNGYIDYPFSTIELEIVEKRNVTEWLRRIRSMSSPLKHVQLKVANVLLQQCQTTSFRRLEWYESTEE